MKSELQSLRKRNNELDKKLSKENDAVMTDMVVYLRVSNISEMQVEIIREDLLRMVLEAEARGDSISAVIGEDYKAFCDQIIENAIPKTMKEKVYEYLSILCSALTVLLTIDIIFSSSEIRRIFKEKSYEYPIDLGFIVSTIIITLSGIFIINYIGKKSFTLREDETQSKPKNWSKRFMRSAIFGVGFALLVIVTVKLSKVVLFSVNIFVLLAVMIVLYVLNKFVFLREV